MPASVRFACSGRFKCQIFEFGWRGGLGMLHFAVGFVALGVCSPADGVFSAKRRGALL
jgi:hypothetical protein